VRAGCKDSGVLDGFLGVGVGPSCDLGWIGGSGNMQLPACCLLANCAGGARSIALWEKARIMLRHLSRSCVCLAPRATRSNKKGCIVAAFRGDERIRTAVRGFADLCLATRPRRHFLNGMQGYGRNPNSPRIWALFSDCTNAKNACAASGLGVLRNKIA
jgi:hypothetical protein